MPRKSCFATLALVSVLAAPGCGRARPKPCASDADCGSGNVCHEKACLTDDEASNALAQRSFSDALYKVGERLEVESEGTFKGATVVRVLGDKLYRVHYDGKDAKWDEDIPETRIKGAASARAAKKPAQ